MKRKFMSLLLILAILVTVLPVNCLKSNAAGAAEARHMGAAKVASETYIGKAHFASEMYTHKDYSLTYYYSDSYFSQSSYVKNPSLATMSMIMAMAAGRSNTADYANKSKNLQELWKDCGFSNIVVNDDFKRQPTNISTAFGCASKKINARGEDYTLIAMAVSGIRAGHEWGGAFIVGEEGPYLAGRYAANRGLEFLKSYIQSKGIKGKVKIWISGYSVAGSIANLLGSDLDNGVNLGNGVRYDAEDIYTYCFECLNTDLTTNALTANLYKNISVYNNPCDFATYLAPKRYNFGVYGVVNKYPTKHGTSDYTSKRAKMLQMLGTIDGSPEYILDNFKEKKISLFGDGYVADDTANDYDACEFLTYMVDALFKSCADTRKQYVDEFQNDMCELADFVLGSDDLNWFDCMDYFAKELSDNILSVGLNMVLGNQEQLAGMFVNYTYTAMQKANVSAPDQKVIVFANTLAKIACRFGSQHPNYTVTLFSNFKYLFQGREATVNLAWLESMDPNYLTEGKNIRFCKAAAANASYTYSGKAIKPSVTVVNGKHKLTDKKDYTVSYSQNTGIGTGKITITGIGAYAGKLTTTFKIVPGKTKVKASSTASGINLKWEKVTGASGYCIYRKSASSSSWKEIAKIKSGGTKTWTDKDVSHAQKYTYAVAAYKESYMGAKSTEVTTCYLKKVKLDKVVSPEKGQLQIRWSSNPSVAGYQVYYSKDKNFNFITKVYDVSRDKVALAVRKLESKTKYYAKVRSYMKVGDRVYYGAWSDVKGVKVK